MESAEQEAKAWTIFHEGGYATTSGAEYIGENVAFFAALLKAATPGRMLDIGTGNMPVPRIALQLQLMEQGLEVHAIDVADILPQYRCPGVHFRQLSSEATDFPDNYFDLITGSYALEYSDVEKSLGELVRVMKPGATAGFILHHPESLVVQQAYSSFKEMQQAQNFERKLLAESGALKKLEGFIAKPNNKNRKPVEALLPRLDKLELVSKLPLLRVVVNAIHTNLQAQARGEALSVEGFRQWARSLKGHGSDNAMRHQLMRQAVVHNPDTLREYLAKLPVSVMRFDTIESDVLQGTSTQGGAQGTVQRAGQMTTRHGLIGWALVFQKRA